MTYSMSFMPAIGFNFTFQVAYYLFFNRFMFRKNVRLFSFTRVALLYSLMHLVHEEIYVKYYLMQSYRVNINDLFDQDEPFLFKSRAFKGLIKRMHDDYNHLINQNFDLSAIT